MAFFFRRAQQPPPPPPPSHPPYCPPPPPPPTMARFFESTLASYISRSRAVDHNEETVERGSLIAVARSIKRCLSEMSRWDISDLTLGLYKIALRHANEGHSDSIDGYTVSEKKELEDLLHWLEWAWSSYLEDEKSIIDFLKIEGLEIVKHNSNAFITKPAYFVALDNMKKSVVVSIRGTYAATDVLTDLQPHSEEFEGGYAHSGILSAARWIMDNETDNLKTLLYENHGYKFVVTGHSLGAGVASLLSFLFYEHANGNISSRLKIPISMIECWGFGCPPCVDKLLSEHAPFIRNVVLQDDIVARVSVAALEDLRDEILQTDWDLVLEDGGIARRMLSLVKNTKTRLDDVERALGHEPGTFFQHVKSIAVASIMEYQRGSMFPPRGHFSSYGPPPPLQPRPSIVGSLLSSCVNNLLVPENSMRDFPVNQSTSSTSTSEVSVKHSRLFVPGILYHIKRIPVSDVLGEEDGKNAQKRAAETSATSSSSTLMRHDVVKGLNPASRFTKIILSKSLLADHTLPAYKDGIKDALCWIHEHR